MIKRFSVLDSTQRITLVFLAIYAVAYLLTRLISLTLLPAHYDELLQLQRIDLMISEGKILEGFDEIYLFKWLQILLIAPLVWLPASPFWLGRFVSVLAGLGGGIGCYVLAVELYRRPAVGIVASFLYLVSPFVLLYDRLIMPDGLLTSLGVWLMIFSVWVVRRHQWRWAVAAGITIAAVGLTKESGFIYLITPLSALILVRPDELLSRRTWQLFSTIYGFALVSLIFLVFVLVLKPEIFLVYVQKTGGEKIFTWQLWLNNSWTALSWLANLMTVPLLILGAAGGVLALFRRDRPGIFLLTIPVMLPLIYILVSKAWFPRYLLPVVPSLSILGAWLLVLLYDHLERFGRLAYWRLPLLISLGLILTGRSMLTDFWLLVDPPQAPLHPREKWQYIEDWPTAYGLAEAADYVESVATEYNMLYLAVNQNSTVVLQGLDIYFDRPTNVDIVTFDAYAGQTIDHLNKWALERPTFLILNTAREKGMNEIWQNPTLFFQGVKRASYSKPGNKASIDVYQWRSVPETAAQWAGRSGVEPSIILSPQYNPAAETLQVGPPTEAELRQANFVLVDISTGLFNSEAQLTNLDEWIELVPPDWALTLYYPGEWYLFRLEKNAPPRYPLQTTLGNIIVLTGFDLPRTEYGAGESMPLTVHWQSIKFTPQNYGVIAQLVSADGTPYAQEELAPGWPTSQWRIGQRLADGHDILLHDDLAPGVYRLLVALHNPSTGERLPAYQNSNHRWANDAVVLTDIVVVQPNDPETE